MHCMKLTVCQKLITEQFRKTRNNEFQPSIDGIPSAGSKRDKSDVANGGFRSSNSAEHLPSERSSISGRPTVIDHA